MGSHQRLPGDPPSPQQWAGAGALASLLLNFLAAQVEQLRVLRLSSLQIAGAIQPLTVSLNLVPPHIIISYMFCSSQELQLIQGPWQQAAPGSRPCTLQPGHLLDLKCGGFTRRGRITVLDPLRCCFIELFLFI